MVVASIRIRLFTPGSLNCEPGASALHDCNICWKTSLKKSALRSSFIRERAERLTGELDAEMVKPFLLALLSLLNLTKTLQIKYLSHEHHYKLDVSARLASLVSLTVFSV